MIFDAHAHLIDPRFPLVPSQGWLPQPYTLADYRRDTHALEVQGGAIVAASFQGDDPQYLLAALHELGPGWVGVAQLAADAGEPLIRELDAAGVRALRLNLRRGVASDTALRAQLRLAHRAWDVAGWHLEVYADLGEPGVPLRELVALPRLVVDHLGLSAAARGPLLELVARGARVKASGFGRLEFDVGERLREIAAIDAGALLFGTDLPGTRAPRPFAVSDLALLRAALGEAAARRALWDNAAALYRLRT